MGLKILDEVGVGVSKMPLVGDFSFLSLKVCIEKPRCQQPVLTSLPSVPSGSSESPTPTSAQRARVHLFFLFLKKHVDFPFGIFNQKPKTFEKPSITYAAFEPKNRHLRKLKFDIFLIENIFRKMAK